MSDLKYTKDHEWLLAEGDEVTIGITDFAQGQLGDIVFIELPETGKECNVGDEVVVIESVKAAGGIKAYVKGTVTAVNDTLVDAPDTVNKDPMGDGWFFKMRIEGDLSGDDFLNQADYDSYLEEC